jgi:hypothetical protein
VGVSAPPARMGWRFTSRCRFGCAVALPPSGCFFDQGVTTFWRRGVWVPHGIVPAEFSTRSLSRPHVALDAVRVFERIAIPHGIVPA